MSRINQLLTGLLGFSLLLFPVRAVEQVHQHSPAPASEQHQPKPGKMDPAEHQMHKMCEEYTKAMQSEFAVLNGLTGEDKVNQLAAMFKKMFEHQNRMHEHMQQMHEKMMQKHGQ